MPEKVHLHEKHTPFKPSQFKIRVNPMPKHQHIQQKAIDEVDESTWYRYSLKCGHEVYSKVRIIVGHNYSYREHYILCQQNHIEPLIWQAVTKMEAANDADVSNVRSVNAFILPNRILRADGHKPNNSIHTSGNPFPYVPKSRDRQYW
jgi:hypothetical protein